MFKFLTKPRQFPKVLNCMSGSLKTFSSIFKTPIPPVTAYETRKKAEAHNEKIEKRIKYLKDCQDFLCPDNPHLLSQDGFCKYNSLLYEAIEEKIEKFKEDFI